MSGKISNAMMQVAKAEEMSFTAGQLLAAEAKYLTVHGWVPHVLQKADAMLDQQQVVAWEKDGKKFYQAEAVRIQKAQDPFVMDPPDLIDMATRTQKPKRPHEYPLAFDNKPADFCARCNGFKRNPNLSPECPG